MFSAEKLCSSNKRRSWSGLWMLHKLRQKGFKSKVAEAYGDVGGVWKYTKYPGCRNETVSTWTFFSKLKKCLVSVLGRQWKSYSALT